MYDYLDTLGQMSETRFQEVGPKYLEQHPLQVLHAE